MARPRFQPTEKDRQQVIVLCGMGLRHTEIAACIFDHKLKPISEPTLRKYFRTELDIGAAKTNGIVAMSLYNRCVAGDTNAIKWYQMNRMGWSERGLSEHSGLGGKPIEVAATVGLVDRTDYENMTKEELQQRYRDRVQGNR